MKVFCTKHPKYNGERLKAKSYCPTCHVVFILRWQHEKNAEQKLGGLNPYQFVEHGKNCGMDDTLGFLRIKE